MTEPTFGYAAAERDGLRPARTRAKGNVNLRALNKVGSPVAAVVMANLVVFAGNPENGMRPVRIEGWISEELVVDA